MYILVINSGSSSLKFKLFDMADHKVMIQGLVEKIGLDGSFLEYENKPAPSLAAGKKLKHIDVQITNHEQALHEVFNLLKTKDYSLTTIVAIGHRVVHGGEEITHPVVIDNRIIEIIRKNIPLAPLHNPANLEGILACQKEMPNTPQVAVFDTAFHQTMEPDHYLYAIPYTYYEQYKIRRYGFHGTSHEYVYETLLNHFDIPRTAKVITCHLGNGSSMTAIKDGRVVETSMGMTPLEGLMMGTRGGNIDPGALTYLMKQEHLSPEQTETILNQKSGLLGVSGTSSDMRDIIEGYKRGEERSVLAMNMYLNAVVKYIGSYVALLGGCDHIILTAGIGERSDFFRKLLLERLSGVGIIIDEKKNISSKKEKRITARKSKIKVRVIPTDEEYMIAHKTMGIVAPLNSAHTGV